MENIEPWNMFSTDFVAEETEELLTDELVAEYGRSMEDAPRVKDEPMDHEEEEDFNEQLNYQEQQQQLNTNSYSRPKADEINDNELFDFSATPHVSHSVQPSPVDTAPMISEQEVQRINYDCAVIFVCPRCGVELDAHDKWKRHIDDAHQYNTRRGLNFVQIDKLYHQCLECKRKIAMHSMENLMKHKFTHLPYKRAKCKICLKQYKYRQDLMVHLRMTHRDDLLAIAKAVTHTPVTHTPVPQRSSIGSQPTYKPTPRSLQIKDIKENAIDIFENTFGEVAIKNEAIDDTENEDMEPTSSTAAAAKYAPPLASNFEESLSRSSSHLSENSLRQRNNATDANTQTEELCVKYIQYICPQCGAEFGTQSQWRQHIEYEHNFGTRDGLNFKEINMKMHAECLECDRVIYVNAIRNLQLHKFTHLQHKSWQRCKLCYRTFVGHKEIVKHLLTQHRLGGETEDDVEDEQTVDDSQDAGMDVTIAGDGDADGDRASDHFETHVDYLCPQCGKEFLDKRMWRKHIVKVHHLTDMKVLNFKVLNERQVICLECNKIITNAYGVQNAQQHKFTHLPYKAFVRCRLCSKSYTDRKGVVKHLRSRHRIGDEPEPASAPNSFAGMMSKLKSSAVQKEIVKHANFTFEIKYLDDDEGDAATARNNASALHDDTPVPELSFNESRSSYSAQQQQKFKCQQCSAVYATQAQLQLHVDDEHEFLDFNNLRPLPETPRTAPRTYQATSFETTPTQKRLDNDFLHGSDSNDLLMPTGDEDVSCSSQDANLERNFCYLCPNCGFECSTQMQWRRHINDVHNYDKRSALNFRPLDKFRYQCIQCNDVISGSKLKGLQDHKFRHLSFRLYIKCLLCGTCYNHKPNMISHLRQRHNIWNDDGPYEQPLSTSPTQMQMTASGMPPKMPIKVVDDTLSYHNAVDHQSITYFCPQCNVNFSSHVYWRKHIVEEHNLNNRQGLNFRQIDEHHYLCLQCYKRVTVTHTKGAIGQLQSHKFRHLPFKSFKCMKCNGYFVRKQMFFKHLNKETNMCDSEPVEDVSSAMLAVDAGAPMPPQQHKQHQQGEQSMSSAAGDSSTQLTDANYEYDDCYILVCPQCGLQFDTQQQWRDHISTEHDLVKREVLNLKRLNANLHECLQCGEHVTGKLRDLQMHKFKHLPFSNYIQCKYCSCSYHHMRNIQEHLRQKHRAILDQQKDTVQVCEEITVPDDDDDENDNDDGAIETTAEHDHVANIDLPEVDDDEQYLLG